MKPKEILSLREGVLYSGMKTDLCTQVRILPPRCPTVKPHPSPLTSWPLTFTELLLCVSHGWSYWRCSSASPFPFALLGWFIAGIRQQLHTLSKHSQTSDLHQKTKLAKSNVKISYGFTEILKRVTV